jgi:hypothetical protein
LEEVSTVRSSGWVRSFRLHEEVSRRTAAHPSATADGTDLFQVRHPEF